MQGQEHLWVFYTNVAENRGNHFRRNSGGQAGGRKATHAEGFQAVFPTGLPPFIGPRLVLVSACYLPPAVKPLHP